MEPFTWSGLALLDGSAFSVLLLTQYLKESPLAVAGIPARWLALGLSYLFAAVCLWLEAGSLSPALLLRSGGAALAIWLMSLGLHRLARRHLGWR